MRKLIVQQWVTVDNIAAEEEGGLSFVSGEPFSETTNPAFKARVMGLIDSVDTRLKLMHSPLDAGVVDEITLLVCPASRGKGTRIFGDWQDLKLVAATSFENGVVLLRYEIKKYPKNFACPDTWPGSSARRRVKA
jgi:hypothetical protein